MDESTKWRRLILRVEGEDNEVFCAWEYSGQYISYYITVREFFSEWGWIRQVTISKEITNEFICGENDDKEPTMIQKEFILDGVKATTGFINPVAFEVYPAKENIVDNLDVYHLWVMEKNKIPFFIDVKIPRLVLKQKSIKINGKHLLYTRKYYRLQNGRFVQVYYVRAADGTELKWYDKQNFKDLVIDENIVAIEFTVERYQKYSVLVCAPKELKKLPFGLRG